MGIIIYLCFFQVVGYSSGVVTSRRFLNNHRNISVFNEIQSIVGIPVKFLHIITNPFENIAARITGEFSQVILCS